MHVVIEGLTPQGLQRHLRTLMVIDRGMLGETWSAEHFAVDLPEKWTCSAIARGDGDVVGFMIASRKLDAVHVHRIAVASSARRRGIGEALLRHAAERAVTLGVSDVTLRVSSSNVVARSFYETMGFACDDEGTGLLEMTLAANRLRRGDRANANHAG